MNRTEKTWMVNAILFVLMFFSVSFFNRLAEDDFLFLQTVQQKGIVNATLAHYDSWNTRWLSIAWLNTWYRLIDLEVPVFIFNWMSLIFLIFSFYVVLQRINISISNRLLYSVIFCCCFFYSSFNIPDTWFWINSNTMYLWNVGFFCLVISRILKSDNLNAGDCIISLLSGLYIGASSEPFLITLLITLPPAVLFLKKQLQLSLTTAILFWTGILIAFVIAFAGTGHEIRSMMLPDTSLMIAISRSLYFTLKILVWHFPVHFIPLILFSIPWLFLGFINPPEKKSLNLSKLLIHFLVLIFLLTYINTLPVVYLMGDAGPARAWTPVSFYICILTAIIFYRAGQQLIVKFKRTLVLFKLSAIMALLFLVVTGVFQIKVASAYAKAYDNKKQFNDMPESGWLHSAKPGGTSPN